jgi:S-adenosylmethionine/arginine decarboxylase-like enzyme
MKPFGYSLLIDMYECCRYALDDLDLHYRLLEELPHRLGMKLMTQPVVCHGLVEFSPYPYKDCNGNLEYFRRDIYLDKAGCSGWVGLITSGIQVHSCVPTNFSTIDIYSCNDFRELIPGIKDFLRSRFKFESYEENLVVRGTKYKG